MSQASEPVSSVALPTLRDLALIADGWRAAVVGPGGEYVWLCFPQWHDPAVFAELIGSRGAYVVRPQGRFVWGGYYEQGGLIWRSRWVTNDATVECREALAFPGDPHRAVILRRILGQYGAARLGVSLELRPDYGGTPLRAWSRDGGSWHGQAGGVAARWTGLPSASAHGAAGGGTRLEGTLVVREGDQIDLVLELADHSIEGDAPDAAACWSATERAWREAVPQRFDGPAPRDVQHAVAVMTGLCSPTGGLVAAATTSLPERARAGRNYDYRYAWIRDSCYAGQAASRLSQTLLHDRIVGFIVERVLADGPHLRPAYTNVGGPVPGERRLDLPGYPGGTDVVGNRVRDQFQLDAFGEVLLLLADAGAQQRLDADGWSAITVAAEAIEARWQEPDAGIWELEPRHWTHSRLTAAQGLRSIARLQPRGAASARWSALADTITAHTARHATHPSGRWQRADDDEGIDAALLAVVARAGPEDPRSIVTLDAVTDTLVRDGYVYRFRAGDLPLGQAEGAFLLCSHLLSIASLRLGRREPAVRIFERARASTGPAGLYTEEFDVGQRQARGNLPQTFVHAMLARAAAAQAADDGRYG